MKTNVYDSEIVVECKLLEYRRDSGVLVSYEGNLLLIPKEELYDPTERFFTSNVGKMIKCVRTNVEERICLSTKLYVARLKRMIKASLDIGFPLQLSGRAVGYVPFDPGLCKIDVGGGLLATISSQDYNRLRVDRIASILKLGDEFVCYPKCITNPSFLECEQIQKNYYELQVQREKASEVEELARLDIKEYGIYLAQLGPRIKNGMGHFVWLSMDLVGIVDNNEVFSHLEIGDRIAILVKRIQILDGKVKLHCAYEGPLSCLQPKIQYIMPDLSGLTINEAVRILKQYRVMKWLYDPCNADQTVVVSTTPTAGELISNYDVVHLAYSNPESNNEATEQEEANSQSNELMDEAMETPFTATEYQFGYYSNRQIVTIEEYHDNLPKRFYETTTRILWLMAFLRYTNIRMLVEAYSRIYSVELSRKTVKSTIDNLTRFGIVGYYTMVPEVSVGLRVYCLTKLGKSYIYKFYGISSRRNDFLGEDATTAIMAKLAENQVMLSLLRNDLIKENLLNMEYCENYKDIHDYVTYHRGVNLIPIDFHRRFLLSDGRTLLIEGVRKTDEQNFSQKLRRISLYAREHKNESFVLILACESMRHIVLVMDLLEKIPVAANLQVYFTFDRKHNDFNVIPVAGKYFYQKKRELKPTFKVFHSQT